MADLENRERQNDRKRHRPVVFSVVGAIALVVALWSAGQSSTQNREATHAARSVAASSCRRVETVKTELRFIFRLARAQTPPGQKAKAERFYAVSLYKLRPERC